MSPVQNDYDSEDEIRGIAFVYFFPNWPLNALIRIYNFSDKYQKVKSQLVPISNDSSLKHLWINLPIILKVRTDSNFLGRKYIHATICCATFRNIA